MTSPQIAAALDEQHQIRIDRRDVVLREPLRHLGSHQVTLRLPARETGIVNVEVVPEVPEEPEPEPAEEPAAEAAEEPAAAAESEPAATADADTAQPEPAPAAAAAAEAS